MLKSYNRCITVPNAVYPVYAAASVSWSGKNLPGSHWEKFSLTVGLCITPTLNFLKNVIKYNTSDTVRRCRGVMATARSQMWKHQNNTWKYVKEWNYSFTMLLLYLKLVHSFGSQRKITVRSAMKSNTCLDLYFQ